MSLLRETMWNNFFTKATIKKMAKLVEFIEDVDFTSMKLTNDVLALEDAIDKRDKIEVNKCYKTLKKRKTLMDSPETAVLRNSRQAYYDLKDTIFPKAKK
jgi:hypothetical protein